MLKVCIATTSFPRWLDDTRGTFIYEAAQAISSCGLSVRVIAMHNPGAKTMEQMGSVDVIRPRYLWPERWEILQREGGGLPVMWQQTRWTRLALLPFLMAHVLAIGRYARGGDIIHANWTLSAAAALVSQPFHRCPIVVTVQGSDIVRATRIPLVKSLTREVLKRCSRVIALSHSLADQVLALGVPESRLVVIPNGVDVKKFVPSTDARESLLVFVGALSEIKGVKYLIKALPRIFSALSEYQLVLVGEGPQQHELETFAHVLGVADRVRFVGPQTPLQVRGWMQRARLLVLPSLEEGLGVVLLEALACGTPCVASQVGGIPDVVVPEVGVLVPPADSKALAEAIIAILTNIGRWTTMSYNARRRAEQEFDWATIAGRLTQIYQQILSVRKL